MDKRDWLARCDDDDIALGGAVEMKHGDVCLVRRRWDGEHGSKARWDRGRQQGVNSPAKKKTTHLFCRIPISTSHNVPARVAQRQVAQLVALVEDVVADGNVDQDRQDDARPDGQVIEEDAQLVEIVVDPAPKLFACQMVLVPTRRHGHTVALPYIFLPLGA